MLPSSPRRLGVQSSDLLDSGEHNVETDTSGLMPGADSHPLPFPLRPRRQRPDPPLAEVQVAEEEGLLELGGEVEHDLDLGS